MMKPRLKIPKQMMFSLFCVAALVSGPAVAETSTPDVEPYSASLSQYDYPYPVNYFNFNAQQQSLQMAYMDVKPKQKAAGTVLLLHGKNFSAAYWKDTIDFLVQAGYRVIAPDQVGFGKSSKPTNFQYSIAGLAANTKTLLDSLKIKHVTVVGHSMGGMIATRFTLMYDDDVESMILVNPIGLEDWQRKVPYASFNTLLKGELAKTPQSIKHYMTESYFDGHWKSKYDPLLAIQAGWAIGPDKKQMAKVGALTSEMVFTQPVVYNFPDINVPSLLVIGTRDRTAIGKNRVSDKVRATLGQYQQLGKKTAEAIPDAKLVEIPGVGHLPQLEAFDTYRKAMLTFLKHQY